MNALTKVSPFRANNERNPRIGFKMKKKGKSERAKEFAKRMKRTQEEAQTALKKAQKEIKKQTNRKKEEAEEYREGDLVLLSTKDIKWQIKKKNRKANGEIPIR